MGNFGRLWDGFQFPQTPAGRDFQDFNAQTSAWPEIYLGQLGHVVRGSLGDSPRIYAKRAKEVAAMLLPGVMHDDRLSIWIEVRSYTCWGAMDMLLGRVSENSACIQGPPGLELAAAREELEGYKALLTLVLMDSTPQMRHSLAPLLVSLETTCADIDACAAEGEIDLRMRSSIGVDDLAAWYKKYPHQAALVNNDPGTYWWRAALSLVPIKDVLRQAAALMA